MAFDLGKLVLPFLLLALGAVVIFTVLPINSGNPVKMYNYQTERNEMVQQVSTLPIIIFTGWSMFVLYWAIRDKGENVIHRTLNSVLNDENSQSQLTVFDITAPHKIIHEAPIGEFPQGNLKAGAILNNLNEIVYLSFVSDDNYKVRESKPKIESPILGISKEMANIIESTRLLKPSMRRTEEAQIEQVFRALKEESKERKEYLKKKVEKTLEEEDDENE
jgi:hypothetical protein